ncbi:hypothetical protein THAR02_02516 [Trichoderma harzianum]|uniref:NWD NACHT-NTPase N-terminal domain-containing protein n=1 Tax=Trichoderma harzianum TaxID=5544 RepID=A0A0F9XKM6_TRIHA|nr:hypothetical protein THAR02_02516 [Trichoderma harzianum]
MNEVNKNTTTLKLRSTEIRMRDVARHVLNVIGATNSYINKAVSANLSASIAWAGVSFLLPLFMNISTESAVQAKGLEYISSLISQSQIREELYVKCYESRKDAQQELQQSHHEYEAALGRLYRQILKFQAKSCCHFSNSSAFRYGLDAVKWNDWAQLVNDVRQRDTEFAAFEQVWQDLQHLEERLIAESLQRETMNSMAAIRTEMSISREAAERAMTKQERDELFSCLCYIDPSSIYNTSRERHEAGTNEWLIHSWEFQNWRRSDGSLLWLHGKERDIELRICGLLSPPNRIEIDLLTQKRTLDNDIHQYISSTLATDNFEDWSVDIKEEVKQSLVKKADSMFQYVRFQLEILQELSSVSEIRKALLDLPVGLDATWDRILENINAKSQRRVINSLKWLAFSKRVLAIEELAEIFIIDPDNDIAFDEDARLFSSSATLKYFSGLIVVEEDQSLSKETVRLVHFSIREYLTSDRIEERLSSAFSFTEADAHIYIARSCLAYLMHLNTTHERSTKTTLNALQENYHLSEYAAKYWAVHLEEVPRAQWPAKATLSAVLADHSLTELMIAEKCGANEYITQEDLDLGLHYAAYGGHLYIVRLFLEKGAKMNARCGKWDSAVYSAVSGGHMNVLEFFVGNGADVNSQSALFTCIPEEGTQLLKYLLDRGMYKDTQDEQHGTALHKAITDTNYWHFTLLLGRGADINPLSEKLGTPLHVACVGLDGYHRYEDRKLRYIEELLDHGADPNICGGKYATALQAACSIISTSKMELAIKAVRLLLEHGADVNVQGGHWGSALHAAAASRSSMEKVELMKLLLDHGAKVDQRGNDGEIPLHVACHQGTIEAVRFLVDRGAHVNAEGGRFGTPIVAAAARGDALPF